MKRFHGVGRPVSPGRKLGVEMLDERAMAAAMGMAMMELESAAPVAVWGGELSAEVAVAAPLPGKAADEEPPLPIPEGEEVRIGDFDRDGDVDTADFTDLILAWTGSGDGCRVGEAPIREDVDGDCDVDAVDFTELLLTWNAGGEDSA